MRERPTVFSEQVPHGIHFQITFGQQPFELAVFLFKLFEPSHILTLQASIFALPSIEGVFTDPVLTAQLRLALLTAGRFLEKADDLLFAELALFDDSTPLVPLLRLESNLSFV